MRHAVHCKHVYTMYFRLFICLSRLMYCSETIKRVIRPPDVVCRMALINAAELYLPGLLSSRSHSNRPSNVYHRFDGRVNSIIPLSILPHPPLIFTGGGQISVKFGLDLRYHSSLSRPHFETKQPVDTRVLRWCSDDDSLFFTNLVQFGRTPLRSRWRSAPFKKLAKSSITQPGIVRFRSNSV